MVLLRAGRLMSCGLLIANCAWLAGAQEASANSIATPVEPVATVAAAAVDVAPQPPKVSCSGNQLTIAAENSTMSSVLAAVRTCTGADIDVPEAFTSERTYMRLGPGPVREVLEALLSSTEYNYVIESSETEPGKIHSVLLMAREDADHKDGNAVLASGDLRLTPARRAWLEARRNARPTEAGVDESGGAEPAPTEARAAEPEVTPAPAAAVVAPAAAAAVEMPKATVAETNVPSETKTDGGRTDGLSAAPVDAAKTAIADATPDPAKSPSTPTVVADAAASSPSDAADSSSQSQERQNRISNMEQLFEQRRQLAQGAAPKPQ